MLVVEGSHAHLGASASDEDPADSHGLLLDTVSAHQAFEVSLCASCTQAKVSINGSFSPSESDFTDLRSGNLPHPRHRSRHDANARAAEKQAHDLEGHIQRLQALTKVLQKHQRASLDFAELQRGLVAPIRCLPNELLLEIFYLACDGTVLTCPLKEDALTAVNLSRVCHWWRVVALGDARMWAMGIDIDTHDRSDSKIVRDVPVMQFSATVGLHLARSGNSPLSLKHIGANIITIDSGEVTERQRPVFYADDFQAMTTRCRHAVFDCTSFRLYLGSRSKYPMPQLETLELTNDEPTRPCELLQDTPRLKSWKQTIPSYRMAKWTCLPQLTRLEMTWMDWTLARGILLDCSCIEHLIIDVYTDPPNLDSPGAHGIATLPHLQTIRARVDPPCTTIGNLLGILSAPCLQHARFIYRVNALGQRVVEEGPGDWPDAQFRDFLQRSGCTMASLELENLLLSKAERDSLRKRLPAATRMVITNIRTVFPHPGADDLYEWEGGAEYQSRSDGEEEI
ncbi:uncharacterized protein SCHCODRAFT_02617598 [Schizophyllum commune H4-8]|uniref:uncharacterized protein n=1 Tax=Schizophyllum commune (strain H4-8 / FGSC 9210) TaxID=578458 RepID=UPI0021607213|nr:uncharacterized protein SCHCODRAFT_02617598 [Schizophyllum commune H4-8]KAI5894695.1 hypothetical protein SCHCODRAFT_02617598 [Schizophyllum commune H4-8]